MESIGGGGRGSSPRSPEALLILALARLPPHWAWDQVLPLCPETDSRAGGVPRAEYHSVCRIFSTRVVWKNSLILGFTA